MQTMEEARMKSNCNRIPILLLNILNSSTIVQKRVEIIRTNQGISLWVYLYQPMAKLATGMQRGEGTSILKTMKIWAKKKVKIMKWSLMKTSPNAVTFTLSSAHETNLAGNTDITLQSLQGLVNAQLRQNYRRRNLLILNRASSHWASVKKILITKCNLVWITRARGSDNRHVIKRWTRSSKKFWRRCGTTTNMAFSITK